VSAELDRGDPRRKTCSSHYVPPGGG
jgi:hypothetical protein